MRKILVVIDMQNDFITGSLGSVEAQKILPSVVKYAETFSGSGEILFTKDTHQPNYLNSRGGKKKAPRNSLCGKHLWLGAGSTLGRFSEKHGYPVFCKRPLAVQNLPNIYSMRIKKNPLMKFSLSVFVQISASYLTL